MDFQYYYPRMNKMQVDSFHPLQQPIPYHMAYPYPMFMQEDSDDERELERLRSMYPKMARRIQPIVEDECDRMEYDGSMMFHQYPDQMRIQQVVEKIYERMHLSEEKENMEESVFATDCPGCDGERGFQGVKDLITMMLFDEMYRRRCRRRRCKRWW